MSKEIDLELVNGRLGRGSGEEPTIAGRRPKATPAMVRGREHDGGETPPSQPPRRQRST